MRRLLWLLVLAASPLVAQSPHAALTGTARSAKHGVVGVTVTISSASLQGTRSTTTVANGDYFFDALPPGAYDIKFAKKGYATVTHRGVLMLAQTARVDADLTPSQEEESITATGTTTTVLETPQIATTLDAALIDQLPIRRGIDDRASLAPGDLLETRESVDGILPLTGFSIPGVVEDSIDETTVIAGAAGPEYGRDFGATIIASTRSGSNDFSASIRDTLTSDQWHEHVAPIIHRSAAIHHSLEATVGGHLVADRIWFFLAGAYLRANSVYALDGFQFSDSPIHQEIARQEGKITAAPSAAASIVATWLHTDEHIGSSGFFPNREAVNAGSIDATAMASGRTLLEAAVSSWRPTLRVPFVSGLRDSTRDILLRGSWLGSDRFGASHTITAGFSDTTFLAPWTERAFFANDRFHTGTHWLFNAGGRVVDVRSDTVFEPRFSAIFDTHGDGHSRWSISWGQYNFSSFTVSKFNEIDLSYAMQIGGNGFIRVDGWHRPFGEGADFQGSYRFLGILDAGGNYTWVRRQEPHVASPRFPLDRANLWLRFALPGVPRGNLTAGILEQDPDVPHQGPVTGISLYYNVPVASASIFAKGDVLDVFNVRGGTGRELRLGLGARF